MPEITLADDFGRAIAQTVLTYGYRSAIEIGSWDGSGSTAILASTLAKQPSPRLVAIESEGDRFGVLAARYADAPWIECYHGSSLSLASLTPQTFEEVWRSPHNLLRYPAEQVRGWWDQCHAYLTTVAAGYLEDNADERFDVALIDGAEFTGWDEFRLLRSRVRCVMLDDCYHAYKGSQARIELLCDPAWHLVWASAYVRNGAAIFVKA
jgi:hypothetical protein